MRRFQVLFATGMCLAVAAVCFATESNPVRSPPTAVAAAPVQRLIVKFRASSEIGISTLARRSSVDLKSAHLITTNLYAVEVEPATSGETIAATLGRLQADSSVEYAVADERRYPHMVPSDPLVPGQWFLQAASATPSAVDALSAWDTSTGSGGVVIADLDTGIRYDHPDLGRAGDAGRVLPGYDFVSNVAVANDGDGRDSDASDPGDWVSRADAATATFGGCSWAATSRTRQACWSPDRRPGARAVRASPAG